MGAVDRLAVDGIEDENIESAGGIFTSSLGSVTHDENPLDAPGLMRMFFPVVVSLLTMIPIFSFENTALASGVRETAVRSTVSGVPFATESDTFAEVCALLAPVPSVIVLGRVERAVEDVGQGDRAGAVVMAAGELQCERGVFERHGVSCSG
jgi:hypothetical protein